MSDKGGCYRSRSFAAACRTHALRHLFTRPYTPRTNGKAKRFIQTSLREWAYARLPQLLHPRRPPPTLAPPLQLAPPPLSSHFKPPISKLPQNQNNLLRLDT
jgi:transposase InsO family protein